MRKAAAVAGLERPARKRRSWAWKGSSSGMGCEEEMGDVRLRVDEIGEIGRIGRIGRIGWLEGDGGLGMEAGGVCERALCGWRCGGMVGG